MPDSRKIDEGGNMEHLKKIEKNLDKETRELIEFSTEMLRISRKRREERSDAIKQSTPYEEVIKMNPYISQYNTLSYY